MKAMKTILAVMALAALAMAQTPASKPKAPASQTVSGTAAPAPKAAATKKPAAAAPATKPGAATQTAKTPAKPAKKPVVSAVAKPGAAKPATAAKATAPVGKRDPFVNPVVRTAAGSGGPMCATGKRCLMVNEMVLRGIVKTQSGNIAVVSNQANRTYFLKENDSVFNGSVVKITPDSVVFRENVVDNLGRESTREVVKRVSAPTV